MPQWTDFQKKIEKKIKENVCNCFSHPCFYISNNLQEFNKKKAKGKQPSHAEIFTETRKMFGKPLKFCFLQENLLTSLFL